MNACCAVLLGLIAVAAAHWDGYPFVPKNEGKYGAAHPYANYGSKAAAKQPGYGYGQVNAGYGLNAGYGYPYGQYGGNDYAHNHEYDFRRYGGFPVHVGAGRFQFLGSYGGHCQSGQDYGFYFTDDNASFMVCDHGRAHRFACPKGTQNKDKATFKHGQAYGMGDLCGVNNYVNAAH